MNRGWYPGQNGNILPAAQLPGVPFAYASQSGGLNSQVPCVEYFDAPIFFGGASGTVTNKSGRMAISIVPGSGSGGSGLILLRNAPSVPYTIDLYGKFVWTPPNAGVSGGSLGILVSNAHGDYRFVQSDYGQQAAAVLAGHQRYSVYTVVGSTTTNNLLVSTSTQANNVYCRMTDNGTMRQHWMSANGLDFMQLYSDASSAFGAATKLGLLVGASGDSTKPNAVADVYNFVVTPGILGDAP